MLYLSSSFTGHSKSIKIRDKTSLVLIYAHREPLSPAKGGLRAPLTLKFGKWGRHWTIVFTRKKRPIRRNQIVQDFRLQVNNQPKLVVFRAQLRLCQILYDDIPMSNLWNTFKSYFWWSSPQNSDKNEDENPLFDLKSLFRSASSLGDSVEHLPNDVVLEILNVLGWREILCLSFSSKHLRSRVESVRSHVSTNAINIQNDKYFSTYSFLNSFYTAFRRGHFSISTIHSRI
jgi:hypothetical protein